MNILREAKGDVCEQVKASKGRGAKSKKEREEILRRTCAGETVKLAKKNGMHKRVKMSVVLRQWCVVIFNLVFFFY